MKTKFFKMSSKLALAALALTGALFTSCVEEDLDTVFTPADPEATVTATVYYAPNGTDVTAQATITGTGTYNTLSGAQNVTVTATIGEATAKEVVSIPQMKSGAVATYHVNLILDDEHEVVKADVSASYEVVAYSTPDANSHAYSHDNSTWFENATDYFYPWTVTVNCPNSIECTSMDLTNLKGSDRNAYMALIDTMEKAETTTTQKLDWQASAWSLSRAKVTYKVTENTYQIKGKKTGIVDGKFVLTEKYSVVTMEPEEIAHPDHSSHYQHGHAHGHGTGNAGGGIVNPD